MAAQDPRPLRLPYRGVGDQTTFTEQPGDICPPALMRNVLPRRIAGDSGRIGIGTRWGTTKMISQQLGSGKPIQAMTVVERSAGVTGLQRGDAITPEGESRIAGALAGHCFILDSAGSMQIGLTDPEAQTALAAAVAWHPTDRKVFFATYFTESGRGKTAINMYNMVDGSKWRAVCQDATVDVYANQIAANDLYVFVAASFWVWVFRVSDGAFLAKYDIDQWAGEVMSVAVRPDGFLAVCFWGTSLAGYGMVNQPSLVRDPFSAMFKRSGVALFEVTTNVASPLTRVRFGPQLASNNAWYESDHAYSRFSEYLNRAPRGCIPYAMAVGPDNEVIVGMTNQGWAWENYTSAYKPDGSVGYTSLLGLDADGYKEFEIDTQSRRVPYPGPWGTWYNDIPSPQMTDLPATGTPKPSVNAVAVDNYGDIYVAGQRNTVSGFNVHKVNSGGNGIAWSFDAGSMVEQHAIAVDPTDNNLYVAVMKNSSWTGASGTSTILLKLNSTTGAVMLNYQPVPAPTWGAWGIAVNSQGEVAFTTDKI